MVFVLSVLACSEPAVAPSEVQELTLWFFEQWDSEEPDDLETAVANLLTFADGVDLEARWDERSYEVGALDPEVLDGKTEHGRDPTVALGVGVLYHSPNPLEEHLGLQFVVDQTPMEPSSPNYYQRTITEGEACFAARTCEVLRYENDILRENVLYEVSYVMEKELMWVAVDGVSHEAMVGRSWMPESAHDEGKISLWQGYSIDLWVPYAQGTLRYQVSWQETEMPGLTWEQVSGVVASGIDDLFEAQDEYIVEEASAR